MGRPPSNGVPSFRFNAYEVAEMEVVLREHDNQMPTNELLANLAEKFSSSSVRSVNSKQKKKRNEKPGRIVVQMKQVWNWFQNRRFAIRSKGIKIPSAVRNIPQDPPPTVVLPPTVIPPPTDQTVLLNSVPDNPPMEFEAKSAQDGAWYDVTEFLSHKSRGTGDLEVKVRFNGFGEEEVEWVNVVKHVRPRSLPCESTECVSVLPGDLVLCFQEGKEQALYFDAHVLNAQRRNHDVRGCRCRFLVRYDHNLAEEIVPLRKICRRPETDYRLQQLQARSNPEAMQKTVAKKTEQTWAPRGNNLAVATMETKIARVESITVRTDHQHNKTDVESRGLEVTVQFAEPSSHVEETSEITPVITNGVLANTVVPPGTMSDPIENDLSDEVTADVAMFGAEENNQPDVTIAVTTAAEENIVVGFENLESCAEPSSHVEETSEIIPVITNGVLANKVVPPGTVSDPIENNLSDEVTADVAMFDAEENNQLDVTVAVTTAAEENIVVGFENLESCAEPSSHVEETSEIDPVITNGVLVNTVVPPGTMSDPIENDLSDEVTADVVMFDVEENNQLDVSVPVTTAAEENIVVEFENLESCAEPSPHVEETSEIVPVITNEVLANTVVPPGTMSDPIENDLLDKVTADVSMFDGEENNQQDVIVPVTTAAEENIVEETSEIAPVITNGVLANTVVPPDPMSDPIENDLLDKVTADVSMFDVEENNQQDVIVPVTTAAEENIVEETSEIAPVITNGVLATMSDTKENDLSNEVTADV
ncbi:uncharacterized protein LOC124944457 isoform X2 [Impatiens glandulifera]|uniref:uncharacterized protein LOC124944457 isoform X2 n=1 Tax=Impatiens glandulifera TaxID=253017 RepID=UPI001FB12FD6|nr:uncharacterized protein LOC124944457 isoform X2 [Impatiens glandulifera]